MTTTTLAVLVVVSFVAPIPLLALLDRPRSSRKD